MKKILAFSLVFILCFGMLCSCDKEETYGEPFTPNLTIDTTDHILHNIEITVEDYGIITLTLDETLAPITVQNFLKLAKQEFYDGLTFHRIIDGFMIQGGDPHGDGSGGSSEKITGEFSANGIENNLSHTRGIISMARLGNSYDSATSQFFIVHQDGYYYYSYYISNTQLDGDYAAFGWVTSGMEFIDAICEDTQVEDSNGTVLAKNQPVIKSIRVIEE